MIQDIIVLYMILPTRQLQCVMFTVCHRVRVASVLIPEILLFLLAFTVFLQLVFCCLVWRNVDS